MVERIYQITENFPRSEGYGLVSQMRRAAVSVPCNIAEGFRRKHAGEYRQFINVALGSCGELETQLEIAQRLGWVPGPQYEELVNEVNELCRMMHTLSKKL